MCSLTLFILLKGNMSKKLKASCCWVSDKVLNTDLSSLGYAYHKKGGNIQRPDGVA